MPNIKKDRTKMLEFKYFTLYVLIIFIQFSNHVKAFTCNANLCYSVKLNGCSNILPNYTGTNTLGICVSDREKSNILSCAQNSNQVCMESSKTMCILLNSDPNDIYIGNYLNSNSNLICIQQSDIQLTQIDPTGIQYLKAGYCFKNDKLIYQGQQLKGSFMCECPQNQCFDGIKCIQMDQYIKVGINLQGKCVGLSVIDNIQNCFNDGQTICLFQITLNTSKCIAYTQNVDIIGVYNYQNANYCLQQSQVNQTIIIDNIVNLNSIYCYHHNQFIQIPNQTLQIIGITSQYYCFLSNSTFNQSDPLKSCIKGYCISQQKCIQMNGYNLISKRQDQTCGGNSENNFLECYTSSTSKTTCINGNSCELILYSNNFIGAQSNFKCVTTNQQIQTAQGLMIMYCAQYFCIYKQEIEVLVSKNDDIYKTVQVQSCQQWFKSDSLGYCLDFNAQNVCLDDNQCLQYDTVQQYYVCVSLASDITQPNFAKEQKTSKCLPYQPIIGQAQNIYKCPSGFCIYTISESQKYCVPLGSFLYGNQYIGAERYSQICLQQFQLSYLGIQWCYGDNCVLKYQNYYICHPLQYQSTYFQTTQSVKAKLQDGTCADLNQTVSINCLAGDYCILQGACVQLDSSNQFTIGRSLEDQTCLPQNTIPAINCAQNFCLINNQCYPLSQLNPARESQTGKCIQANDPGMFGASSCHIDFCLFIGTTQNQNVCLQIDYQQQNQLGRYQGTGICVSQNDQNIPHLTQKIQLCFNGVYCIATNTNGEYCQKVEGLYKCQDSQGKCVLLTDTTSCSRCSFSECLLNGHCVELDAKYCQDSNGNCLDVNEAGCKVCPQNYCLQEASQTCQYYYQLLSSYSKSECLYQYRQDMPCFKQNIDNMNQYKILLCKDKNTLCQNMKIANQNKQCLVCPKYFFNPGDNSCYQQVKQVSNSYFNFQLQYILEDCYPNSDCSSNSWKCPEGCRKCSNQNTCTQCIEGYFLFQDIANQNQICIKCVSQQYIQDVNPISQLFSFVKQITYECAECNLELNEWKDQTLNNKICTQMVTNFAGFNKYDPYFSETTYYQIQKGFTQGIPYFQQMKNPLSYLYLQQKQQYSQCSNQCIRCLQDQLGVSRCIKCQYLYYVTPQYECKPCPSQCLECGMSLLVGTQFFNFEDLSYEQYLNGIFSMNSAMFSCRYCQTGFLINYDFQSCIPCGVECQECVYVLPDGKFTNKKYYNFGIYQAQNIQPYCLRCSPGYKRAANRFDCSKMIQDYCYDYDIISSINLKSTKTYLDYGYEPGETTVLNCNYCLPNTCLSPQFKNCIDFGSSPMDLNSTSIICQSYVQQALSIVGGDYEYNSCLYNYPLAITVSGSLSCDSTKQCNKLIQNCLNCFEFQHYQDGLLFQCNECKEGFIPSVSGCIPCPKGCLNCYETGYYQQQKVNFTNIFIYERSILLSLTLSQRIGYYDLFSIQMLCSVCESGRVLSSTQASCDFIICGKYCQTCIYYQDQPFCVQCNSNLLFSEILPIQMNIAQMYFNSIFLNQIDLMISLDQNQQNCKLCPMLCETCQDKSNYFLNGAYDLYDTKCYSCKQKITSQYQELERYEIRYDKKRMKCQLCLKTDNGCYFKKQSHVYVFCGSYDQNLGSGTQTDPYNLFKISQLNIDSLILNEADVNRAYVFYNELQLRELELIIQYVDQGGVCIENVGFNLKTNLKSTISSLEFLTLTIRADQSKDYQTFFTVKQIAVAQISGFSQIQIQNLNIISKQTVGYFGYLSQNTTINQIQLQNVTFSSQSQAPNLLWLNFQYFNGTLIINNVFFNNITIQNNSLINLKFQQITTPQTYSITNVAFQNCAFVSSQFIIFQFQGELNVYNFQINQSNFTQKSTFILASLHNLNTTSAFNLTKISINDSSFYNNSIVVYSQNFNQTTLSKLDLFNNKIISDNSYQKQVPSLFYLDEIKISQLQFVSNILYNTIIFQLSAIQQSSNLQQYNFTSFEIHSNIFNTNTAIIFQLSQSQNSKVNITDFQIKGNKYNIQNVSYQNNKFFSFNSITSLTIINLSIQDDIIVQFLTIQSIQIIDLNVINVGQLARQSFAYNILNFQGVNSTCVIKNVGLRQLTTYQQLILIHQIMNRINSNDREQFQIKLLNFTFNEIELKRNPPISQEIPIQSLIEIKSKIDGNVLINNFKGTNIYRKFNKAEEYLQTELFLSTVLLIQMQIGFLQIENSFIQSYYVHPSHNILQISCYQINLVNSSFYLQENQNTKFALDDSTLKGGILNLYAPQVQIFNVTFQGGLALQGGAIYFQSQQQTKVYIQQSNFIDNWSFNIKNKQECLGGAIHIDISLSQSTIEFFVLNSTFKNNLSLHQGGSIYITNSFLKYFFISQYNHFTDNLSLSGSNIYSFQSKPTSQITIYKTLVQITDQFQIFTLNLLPYFSQYMLESATISLFSFQNFYSVDIIQCIFQSSQSNSQLSDAKLARLSFQVIMNFRSITLLTQDQNYYNQLQVYNNLITILNSQKLLIQWDTFNNNQLANLLLYPNSTQIKSFISINSNSVIIKYLKFQNNICTLCDQGNIFIDSSHLFVYQSIFQGNTALNGGSLYLQMTTQTNNNRILQLTDIRDYQILFSQANQTILNCSFIENTALQSGGSIFIDNTLLYLSNLLFDGNKANMYGGAVASDNSFSQALQNIELTFSTFMNNQALIGSVFFQMQNLPIQKIFQNTLKNNFAKLYGNQLQQSAVGFIGILNGKQYNSNIIIQNFLSGVVQDDLQIQLINTENQAISQLKNDIVLKLEVGVGDFAVFPSEIKQNNGFFNLSNILYVYGRLGQEIKIKLTSDFNYIPNYDLQGNLIKISQNIYFELYFQFRKLCPKGTTLVQDNNKKDMCYNCPTSTFSLADGQNCNKCPFVCKNSQMFLPNGYWRYSLMSYEYQECYLSQNCVGDIDRQISQKLQSTTNRYCRDGNIGALCMDCDLNGIYWEKRYQQITPYTCQECDGFKNFPSLTILFINISFYGLVINIINKQIQVQKLKKVFYLLKVNLLQNYEAFNLMKIFINYFAILGLINPLINLLPIFLQQLIFELFNIPTNMLKLLDCKFSLLYDSQTIPYCHLRIIISLIVLCIVFILIHLIAQIYLRSDKITTLAAFFFLQIHNIPYLVKLFVGIVSYITVQGQNYLKDFPSIPLNTKQTGFILAISLIFFQILFLIALYIFLSKKKYFLENERVLLYLKFMYQDYYYYWWEIASSFYKILLFLVEGVYFQQQILRDTICCSICFSYTTSILYFQPYKRKELNYIEVIISFGLSVSFGLMSYLSQKDYLNESLTVICFINISIIVLIAYKLSQNYIQIFLSYFTNKKQIQKNSKLFWRLIKQRILSQPKHLLTQQYKEILEKQISKNYLSFKNYQIKQKLAKLKQSDLKQINKSKCSKSNILCLTD